MQTGIMWEVTKALYGLRASPADWGAHRDDTLRRWKVDIGGGQVLVLHQAFADENLWKIKLGKATVGFICCYVDDMMIIGEQSIVEVMAGHIKKEWDHGPGVGQHQEGVEVLRCVVKPGGGGEILVGQEDYIQDVINRYGSEVKEKLIPVPKEIEKDGEDEEQDMEMVRRAQTLSGELLWATRTSAMA